MYLTISPGKASKTGRSLGIALPSFYAEQFDIEKGDDGCVGFGSDHNDRSLLSRSHSKMRR